MMDMRVGRFEVATSSDGGHSPEFFAERVCARMISIAATAPPEVRLQAEAFRERLMAVVLDGIRQAIASDRAYRK